MPGQAMIECSRTVSSAEGRALRSELRDFYEDYAVLLDEGEIERWPDFFTDDCIYKAISRENYDQGYPHATMYCDGIGMIRDRVMALRETSVFEPRSLRHLISGTRIREVDEDGVISAQANYAVFESMSNRDPRVFNVGRYVDRIVRTDDGFRFQEHLAVFDNYRIITSLIWPL